MDDEGGSINSEVSLYIDHRMRAAFYSIIMHVRL